MSQVVEQVSTEILERLLALENPSKEDVNKVKIEVCRKYKSPFVPANSSILELLSDDLRPRLRPVLTDKQVRGISGVTTVAVMPKPSGCPHGKNVGITVETRPEWSRRDHVDHMMSMGVTRVEIGVQTLYDDV